MKSHLLVFTLSLLGTLCCLGPVASLACDRCKQAGYPGSCDTCSQNLAPCNDPCCNDEGILDRSAKMLGAVHQRTRSLFGLKQRRNSCDACGQASCGCEIQIESNCGCEISAPGPGCDTCSAKPCPSMDRENLLSRLMSRRSTRQCDTGPSCGCESLAECDCYEVQPMPRPIPRTPSCGCESAPCNCDSRSPCAPSRGGLLSRLLHKDSRSCDHIDPCGCDSPRSFKRRPLFQPSCEPPKPNIFERMLIEHRARSCDSSVDCGCEVNTPCSGDIASCDTCDTGSRSGLLHRLFRKSSGCCGSESTCDCSVEAGCGCESATLHGQHCSECQGDAGHHVIEHPMQHHHPLQQVAPLQDAPSQPQTFESMPQFRKPEIDPAPTPPSSRPSRLNAQPTPVPAPPKADRSLPDDEVNPFRDDAANRTRRLPTEAIRFDRKSQTRSYGSAYDPQASNAVHFRFSDLENGEPEGIRYASRGTRPLERVDQPTSSRLVPASANSARSGDTGIQPAHHAERRLRLR